MIKRLFFLGREGWFELEMTLAEAVEINAKTSEDLIRLAYMMMHRNGYRNYVITENPDFDIKGRIKNRAMGHVS